jgi:hypothetical protein
VEGRVLVLGAQGVLGAAVARALHDEGWDVLRAGRRLEDSPDFRLVDLDRAQTVAAAASEADIIISCVLHPDFPAERLVLRDGGTLLAAASLTRVQHASLANEHPSARGLVVQVGLAPGVTDVVVSQMLAEAPEADRIDVASTHSIFQSAGRNSLEFFWPFLTGQAHRPTRTISFPNPFGELQCVEVSSGEEGWLAEVSGDRSAHVWLCVPEPAFRAGLLALNALHLLRMLPRPPGLPSVGRRRGELSSEPKCFAIAVSGDGRPIIVRTIEGLGDYRMTVAGTAALTESVVALQRRDPSLRGVWWASELFTFAELRPGLEARGIRFRERVAAG